MEHCPNCKGVVSPAFKSDTAKKVIDLKIWEVHEFPWGAAVKKRNGKWTHVFIGEQSLNVENMNVLLHENGIEFL